VKLSFPAGATGDRVAVAGGGRVVEPFTVEPDPARATARDAEPRRPPEPTPSGGFRQ
jgi:hypothetical protein